MVVNVKCRTQRSSSIMCGRLDEHLLEWGLLKDLAVESTVECDPTCVTKLGILIPLAQPFQQVQDDGLQPFLKSCCDVGMMVFKR